MATTSPFDFMIQYLKKEDIKIDYEEYKLQTETHPDYPSLLSFSDSLSFFNIDNLATRIPKDQYQNLPERFVALMEPNNKASFLTYVSQSKNGFEYLDEGSMKSLNTDSFLSLWSGIVLIAEQTEETVKYESHKATFGKIAIPFLLLFTALLTFSNQSGYLLSGLAALSMLGVFLASEALKQEFGVKNTLSSGVCNASTATDCKAVINSEKAKFFGTLGLSDISIIFFVSQFLSLLIVGLSNFQASFFQLTFLSLAISVPITIYSFYYQYMIAKKWCPVCLGIAGVLYIQLAIFLFAFDNLTFTVNWLGIGTIAALYLFFTSFWLQLKPYIKEFFTLRSSNLDNMRFRRNYTLFKNVLLTTPEVEPTIMSSHIQLGNKKSPLQISMVTNPFCKFCEAAHETIHTIIKRNDLDVGINLRFNVNTDKTDQKSILLHQGFVEIYQQKGTGAFMEAMDYWFSIKDIDKWLSKYNTSGSPEKSILSIFDKEFEENAKNELLFTPAIIINRHLYPKMYMPGDLKGFVSELLEDEDIINQNTHLEVL